MQQIALIGECMIELSGTPFGVMQQTFGGDVLNSAVYLARAVRQQMSVHFVSAMGVDSLSEGMINRWQQEGINTQLVLRDELHQPGLYMIQLDARGERSFLYWRKDSAARWLLQHPEFSRIAHALQAVDVIYVSGISLAILPAADRLSLMSLLEMLAEQGKLIIFDSNYRPALWDSAEQTRHCYQRLLAVTSLALVTDDDEQRLWGDGNIAATLRRLQQAGVKKAVVKAGAQGCWWQDFTQPAAPLLIPTQPVANVVDTTSAGDAFNAGFLAGFLSGHGGEQAAKMGHQLAGVVIQHKGAIVPREATQTVTDSFSIYA
ncbi:sugar kinase [Rouxiella sp. Mn2063]|uniref:sugar kinase n=1 Tax=Rouxiella sp. Mn2063 TaxID=3395262 RepID=UPI003BC14BD9